MRRDDALLLDMLLAARKRIRFTQNMDEHAFYAHDLVQSAVIRALQVLGEAARMLTDETKLLYPQIPWRIMAGMRRRLIYAYVAIRVDVVWTTIQRDISSLAAHLAALVHPNRRVTMMFPDSPGADVWSRLCATPALIGAKECMHDGRALPQGCTWFARSSNVFQRAHPVPPSRTHVLQG